MSVPGALSINLCSICTSLCMMQGSDCVAPFQAMQQCMVKHPQAFAEYVQAKDADTEQKTNAIGLLKTDQ